MTSKSISRLSEMAGQALARCTQPKSEATKELAARDRRQRRHLWDNCGAPDLHAKDRDRLWQWLQKPTGPWGEALAKLRSDKKTGYLSALVGTRGTGKTQLAVCLLYDACFDLRRCRYIEAATLCDALRAGVGEERGVMRRLNEFADFEFLVIDEMALRLHTEFEDIQLTRLLDRRYHIAGHDTLLISNEVPKQFIEAVGSSIASRIQETGRIIETKWPSFREDKANE